MTPTHKKARVLSVWWEDSERAWIVDNGLEQVRVRQRMMDPVTGFFEPGRRAQYELKRTMRLYVTEREECGCAQCLTELGR